MLRGGSGDGSTAAVVWAVGDGADGSETAREVAGLVAADDPDRFVYLGDVYESGSAAEFETNFGDVYEDLLAITSPTPGNHDWHVQTVGYSPFWERAQGEPVDPWYAFELSGWELISLNSEARHGAEDPQLEWLRRQVADGGDCRIAFWHRPRYSAGRHGDLPSIQPFWDALEGTARLVLNGHDHNYQRFDPIDGITEVVVGTGGHHLYELRNEERPDLAAAEDTVYGALRIELRPDEAELAYVAASGEVLDRDSVSCTPG